MDCRADISFLFFLSLLVRSYLSITPGSATLEILINKKTQKKHTKKPTKTQKNFWLNFCLNKECPKLLCGLGTQLAIYMGPIWVPYGHPYWTHMGSATGFRMGPIWAGPCK